MTAQGFYAVLPNNPRYTKDVFERIDATLDVLSYHQSARESCNIAIKSFFALASTNPSSLDVRFRASMDSLTLELGVKSGRLLESDSDLARIEQEMDTVVVFANHSRISMTKLRTETPMRSDSEIIISI